MKRIAEVASQVATPNASILEVSLFTPFRFDSEEAPEILVTDINLLQSLLRERTSVPNRDPDDEDL